MQERKISIAPVTRTSTDSCRISLPQTPLLLRNRESAYSYGQCHTIIHVVTIVLFSTVHTILMETSLDLTPFSDYEVMAFTAKGRKTLKILMKEESYYRGFKNMKDDFFILHS